MKKIKLLLLVMFALSPTLPADAATASVSTFACPRCQAPLKNKDALYYHNKTSHQKEIAQEIAEKKEKTLKSTLCYVCGQNFDSLQETEAHLTAHHNEYHNTKSHAYNCLECTLLLCSQENLDEHNLCFHIPEAQRQQAIESMKNAIRTEQQLLHLDLSALKAYTDALTLPTIDFLAPGYPFQHQPLLPNQTFQDFWNSILLPASDQQ